MKVSFEGIGESVITFYNDGDNGAVAGVPVKISGNGEVSACGAGERFFGVALAGEGDFAAVQVQGFVQLIYSGNAPSVGFVQLAADGSGGVKAVEADGGEFLAVEVDTTNKILGVML